MDGPGDGRTLNPEICSDISKRICNFRSRLERLGTKTGLPEIVRDWGDATVSVKHILIKVPHIVIPGVANQVHIIPLHEVLKGIVIVRIHDCTELIHCQGSTVVVYST